MINIPKIIHYCWFGGKEKNSFILKCIESWKKSFPDYEIKEWNEENFDINKNEFVKEAYENKKYAFVSDYVRLEAIYQYGGIYFDVDIEVLKNFEKYLNKELILCFEKDELIMTGFFAAQKGTKFIKEILDSYENKKFLDENGNMNLEPNTIIFSKKVFEEYGILKNGQMQENNNIIVYPNEVFCAYDRNFNSYNISDKTVSIHHYNGTWLTWDKKIKNKIKTIIIKVLGKERWKKIKK